MKIHSKKLFEGLRITFDTYFSSYFYIQLQLPTTNIICKITTTTNKQTQHQIKAILLFFFMRHEIFLSYQINAKNTL
jgi:hypothetical protein